MKVSEILRFTGLKSNEIKQRFNNRQILLFGEKLLTDLELDTKLDEDRNPILTSMGNFLFNLIKENPSLIPILKILDLESIPISNLGNNIKDIFKNKIILRISKKDIYVIEKNDAF